MSRPAPPLVSRLSSLELSTLSSVEFEGRRTAVPVAEDSEDSRAFSLLSRPHRDEREREGPSIASEPDVSAVASMAVASSTFPFVRLDFAIGFALCEP